MKLMGLISELAIIRGKIHTMKDNPPFKTNEEVKVKRQSGRGMYWTNYDEGNLRLQVTKYGSKYEANFYKLGGSSQPSWKLELKDLSKNDATALGKLVKSKGVKASAKVAKSKYKKHISEGKKVKIDTIKNNIKLVLDVEIEAQNIINALKADKKKLTLNNISNYINAEYKFFKTPSLNHQVFKHIKKNLKKLSEGKLNEKKKKYIKDLSPEEFKVYRKAAMLKSYGKITQQKFDSVVKKLVGEGKLNEKAKRNYKEEYKKYGSSKKAKKYRAELNKYNRQKGTYGNGDGLDASHMNGKIVGFEEQSINRGRAEKSRLKKEGKLTEKFDSYRWRDVHSWALDWESELASLINSKELKSVMKDKNSKVKTITKRLFKSLKDVHTGFDGLKDELKKIYGEGKLKEGKGVDKVLSMANDNSFGKLGGKTVDAMSANLFKTVYDKLTGSNKEKIDKMNEKQLYVFMTKLWTKFGKQVRI